MNIFLMIIIIFFSGYVFADQAEQITLSGYTEEGQKKWDLNSETAEISSTKSIKLNKPTGVLYKDGQPNVKMRANEGVYNRQEDNVTLKENVIVEEQSGGVLSADSLEWNSDKSTLKTDGSVVVTKDNKVLTGDKLTVDKNKETVVLEENVKIKAFKDSKSQHPTIITCTGKMEVNYKERIAEFFDNVVVADSDATLKADYMKILLNKEQQSIESITCSGNVIIVQGTKKASSQKAVYNALEKTIQLTGDPKVMKDDNLLTADIITFYIEDERVVCEPQARLVIFPSDADKEIFKL